MRAKTSKETADREKACRFVLAAFFRQGQEIARLLAELFLPHLQEGDAEPDFYGTIVAIGHKLKDSIDRVVAADASLFAANAALEAERAGRKRKAAVLSRQVMGLRGACNSLLVDLPVQRLGFDDRTFQDPVPLLIQADRVVASLEDAAVGDARLFQDVEFDPKAYATAVRESAVELRECLDHLDDLRRGADTALLDKRSLTEKYDDLFLQGARTFESYCRMAGKTELADRVRPSIRRSGRTVVPPDDASPDDVPADDVPAGDVPAGDVPAGDVPPDDAPLPGDPTSRAATRGTTPRPAPCWRRSTSGSRASAPGATGSPAAPGPTPTCKPARATSPAPAP